MRQIVLEAHVLPYFAILSPWKLNIDLLEVCNSSFTSSWSQFWTHPVCLSAWNHALPCCNPTQQCGMYMQSHQIDTLLTGQGLWLLMRRNTMKRGSPCSKYLLSFHHGSQILWLLQTAMTVQQRPHQYWFSSNLCPSTARAAHASSSVQITASNVPAFLFHPDNFILL